MNIVDVMRELESLGSAQTRALYQRHGAGQQVFGVKFGDLEKLRKRLKRNQGLAMALWASENVDARCLATMIADPASCSPELLREWAGNIAYYTLADLFARNLVAKSPHAAALAEEWSRTAGEWTARCGWTTYAVLAMEEKLVEDKVWQGLLTRIEREIHAAPNRTKDAMNNTLIAIGLRNPLLQELALAAAGRIGKVEVDHGDTGCKTPDAAAYILKAATRKQDGTR